MHLGFIKCKHCYNVIERGPMRSGFLYVFFFFRYSPGIKGFAFYVNNVTYTTF